MKVLNTYIVSEKMNTGLAVKTLLYELEDRSWMLNCPKYHETTGLTTFKLLPISAEKAKELMTQKVTFASV
ncbi:hypothetical protein AHMF7605_28375 [Adhaeribacter arboris]|uniref:Uncharacterized protein n=1 Tax=Adhaeribacter arboris TaxID=2072846 RepID=A0A2T2YNN3_9BACT|nr:hypothetical protein [Adhaeribacter arboris]PSR57117.1 hypothetical protein AHMF7605_28375 [Adhaeribacter arboris]